MKMHVNFYNDFFDNVVTGTEQIEWSELVTLFSEFTESESKDAVSLFNLCLFKDKDFVPASRKIFANGEYTGERELKLSKNAGVQVGRYAENIIAYSALVLDYDGNGASLENALGRFSAFTHLGYTSYRHAITGVDKFRVILPFSSPCPIDEWEKRKGSFKEFAGPTVDNSTVATARAFYLPSHPAEGKEHSLAWNIDGVVLDWDLFEAREIHQPQPCIEANDTELTTVLDDLKAAMPHVPPYEERFVLVRAVAKHLGKAEAVQQMRSRWPDTDLNGKYEDMVSAPLKANGPGLGSIIYQLRSIQPNYTVRKNETTDRWGHNTIRKSLSNKDLTI